MWLRRAVALIRFVPIENVRAGSATSFIHHHLHHHVRHHARNVAFAACAIATLMRAPTPAAAQTPTLATVHASATTSTVGATVTLSADITPLLGGGGTPTGNVQFYVNGVAAGAPPAPGGRGDAPPPAGPPRAR